MKAKIQFIKSLDEKVLHHICLTRSKYDNTIRTTFHFKNPNILNKNIAKNGKVISIYLINKEGTLETRYKCKIC